MDFAVLRELLIEHADYLAVVKLQGGEPLHYSNIVELVDLLNELKIPFDILTNGSLLTKELCKKLVGSYCFNISISLDAGSNETYRYLRRGGELPPSSVESTAAERDQEGTCFKQTDAQRLDVHVFREHRRGLRIGGNM